MKLWEIIGIGAGAAGLGVGGGIFLGKWLEKRKYDLFEEKYVNYDNYIPDPETVQPKATIRKIEDMKEARVVEPLNNARDKIAALMRSKAELNDIIRGNGYGDTDGDRASTIPPVEEGAAPQLISEEEFNKGTYSQRSFFCYEDRVLVDIDADVVVDPSDAETMLGRNWWELFGTGADDDAIYIRNHEMATDFEVIRMYKYYEPDDLVLPEDLDDLEDDIDDEEEGDDNV